MTARILVVDDIEANRKLLETRLTAEYFEVVTAANGMEALEICAREPTDIVLLDVMMPGINGFEVCKRLKSDPKTQHIPVIMVTALDQPSDKVYGLQAGADDFLTKPVDDVALITRVRNLARLKRLNDELLTRVATGMQLGLQVAPDGEGQGSDDLAAGGEILLVEDRSRAARRIAETLGKFHRVEIEPDARLAFERARQKAFDLMIVSLDLEGADGLRLCSQIRSNDTTRDLPLLILVDEGDGQRLLRGLDMGVNDYLRRPVDRNEMVARVRTQIRHKRFSDRLRQTLASSVDMALTDPLTGLHNRRYFDMHFATVLEKARREKLPFALLLLDIDFFKKVNDTFGHDAGDAVLKEFASRIKRFTRGSDLTCRLGGEEFVVLLQNTGLDEGFLMAERLRLLIVDAPFDIAGTSQPLNITCSIGVTAFEFADDTQASVLKRADQALYRAKREGRNRIATSIIYAEIA